MQDLVPILEQAAHDLLLWIGFGTVVGLTAKAVMPGKDPGGPIATFLMGIAGSVIGCGVLMFWTGEADVSPISLPGFGLGTAGAFVLLFFARLASGTLVETRDGVWYFFGRRPRRRRRVLVND